MSRFLMIEVIAGYYIRTGPGVITNFVLKIDPAQINFEVEGNLGTALIAI